MHAKTTPLPVGVGGDGPAEDNLSFGFDVYAEALAGLIANRENTTPLVVGVFGPRGAGKTTLLKTIKARLDSGALGDPGRYRHCKTVWFQAWKYNHREETLAALVEAIFKAMAADGFFSLARAKIDTLTRRFDKSKIFASISKLAAGADISEFFSELDFKEELGFFETFQKFFDDLIWTFLNWRFKLSGQEKPDDKMGAMVIVIDDLDQCHTSRIRKVLETIKLYMDRTGCIFVIGACAEILQKALTREYGPQDARLFIEKIVQVRFTLPQILPEQFAQLVQDCKIDKSNVQAVITHLPLIMPKLGHSPRRLKGFINSLNLLNGLLHSVNVQIGFNKVLAWAMIVYLFGDLAGDIKANPDRLFALREQIERLGNKFAETPVWKLSPERLHTENVPDFLQGYIQRRHLAEIVMGLDITPEELQCLRSLSGSVLSPDE